jgi:phosphosulfolactate phosphohydrolase-like enzyme
LSGIQKVLKGIKDSGAAVELVLPNMGAETVKLADVKGRVVVAATGCGGVAFDAAMTAGAPAVLTGTVARTAKKKGSAPAMAAVERALKTARQLKADIAVIAASGNSVEDVLAAEYIFNLLLGVSRM